MPDMAGHRAAHAGMAGYGLAQPATRPRCTQPYCTRPSQLSIPGLTFTALFLLQCFELLVCDTTVVLFFFLITPSVSADIPPVPRVELLETYLANTQC